jgi:CBS domain-containing protein
VKQVKIKDVMTPNVEFINASDSVADAARKMKEINVGILPVFANNRLVGMITDRDIAVRSVAEGHDPKTTTVDQIMTRDIVSCLEDEDVTEALKLMEENKIRRLIVHDDQNNVVGILSLGDLAVQLGASLIGETLREVSHPARPER